MNWKRIAGRRIAVLGDLMLDEHVHGTASRLSPEAPVPVVQVTSRTLHPGGAANVAMNIAALSGQVELAGVTGQDEGAALLRKNLPANIGSTAIIALASRCTSRKTRVLADGYHHIVRFDEEVRSPLDTAGEQLLWEQLEPIIANCNTLVLSDYAKGVLTPGLCRLAIAKANASGIPVVVDPKDSDFTRYKGATVITPNYKEATAAAARINSPASDIEQIGQDLMAAYGTALVLTLGAKGMSVFSKPGAAAVHIPTRARRVFDVTGAGDTVVAVLALALAAGLSLVEAAAMSTEAAGRVVQMPGTATVTLDELMSGDSED